MTELNVWGVNGGAIDDLTPQLNDPEELEVYRPLPQRLEIIERAHRGEETAVLAAADYRFIQGTQWQRIIEDKQHLEEGHDSFERWCKERGYGDTTVRNYARFFLFCKECDALDTPRPSSIAQVKAFEGYGNLKKRVQLWGLLAERDEPISGKAIRRELEGGPRARAVDEEEGESLEYIELRRQQEIVEEHRAELEAREDGIAKFEERARKLAEQEVKVQEERDRIDRIADRLESQYALAIADIQAKYGEPVKPAFLEISDEAWFKAFSEAESTRVKEVAKKLHNITGWPKWMGEFFPSEAADAILGMDQGHLLTEALYYVIDWLQRTVDEVETRERR